MRKLTFVAGVAVGFVLGARSGRETYDRLAAAARRFCENPTVRNAADSAAHSTREVASRAGAVVANRAGEHLPSPLTDRLWTGGERSHRHTDGWGTRT